MLNKLCLINWKEYENKLRKWFSSHCNYLLTIVAISSMIFPSPIIIGPASAKIIALGCTTVLGPIVISPFSMLSSHTIAPTAIFSLKCS